MKTFVIAVTLLSTSLFNQTYALGNGNPINMNEKLDEVVKFQPNELLIDKNHKAFVKVSFKINAFGKVEILEMNYSDEKVKKQLVKKLEKIHIESAYDLDKVYNYNFKFEKR